MSTNNPYGSYPSSGGSPDDSNPYNTSGGSSDSNASEFHGYDSSSATGDYNSTDSGFGSYPSNGTANYSADPYGAYGAYPTSGDELAAGSQYTSTGKRFLGIFIDGLIFVIINFVLTYFIAGDELSEWFDIASNSTDPEAVPDIPLGGVAIASLITFILWWVYRIGMETTKGGSLGHLALGNRVINANGTNPTAVQSFKRNLWYLIASLASIVPIIGFLILIAVYTAVGVTISRSPLNQSFTDKWGHCVVVEKR